MSRQPTFATEQSLLAIWQRLLQRTSLQIDDDFFQVGGDASLAGQLFAEIAEHFGRRLPPEIIYQAPSVAALAALLEKAEVPSCPPLVLKKEGDDPPVFIAPGLGASIFELFPLVHHIRTTHKIYALQAKGLEGLSDPLSSVEDMARYHLGAMKQVQPRGPYFLIGYSLGGLEVMEIAQRLLKCGEQVALLTMVDSYPHRTALRPWQHVKLVTRLLKRRILGGTPGDAHGPSTAPGLERVRAGAMLALANYRPKFYAGEIKFVKAEIPTRFSADPSAVWRKLIDDFSLETSPGNHISMLKMHSPSVAAILSRHLEVAASRNAVKQARDLET